MQKKPITVDELRLAGVPIVPIVIHDALCGWRVASEQSTKPGDNGATFGAR